MKLFKFIFKVLLLPFTILGLILSLFTPAAATTKQRNPYDENYFTNQLAGRKFQKEYEIKFLQGTTQKLPNRFRADLWTSESVVEVDWEHKMYEGLGQALTYSYYSEGYKPGIVILDDINKNTNYHKFLDVFKHHGVKYWIVEVNRDTGEIRGITESE